MKTWPSKTKILIWKFIPITHSIIYHHQKTKKCFFAAQKSFRVLSDKVLFRFHSDGVLFMVLSNRILFESSVIHSSLESPVLFFRHVAIFLLKPAATVFIKNRFSVLHYIFIMCFNNLKKTDSEKHEEILHDRDKILYWKYMSSSFQFMNYLYCWIYNSYILHKKLNKILLGPKWPFVSFWKPKITLFYFLSLAFIRCTTRGHSLSHVVFYCHFLSLVVTFCHSLSRVVPLVVIRFTSCLSFFKWSYFDRC